MRTAVESDCCVPFFPRVRTWSPCRASVLIGVGQNPEPLSDVGRADIIATEDAVSHFVSSFSQVAADGLPVGESQESRDILKPSEAWTDSADDFDCFRPAVSFVSFGELQPGHAERLAREATGHDINQARVAVSISAANKLSDIATIDGRVVEKPVRDSLREHAAAVGFALHISERAPAEQVTSEQSAAASRVE
jgi:hypothetical protein